MGMASCKECQNYITCKLESGSPYYDFFGVVNVEFNCAHFKSNNIGERTRCPMRHRNGNCLPIGGFCTSVNDEICTALHKAFDNGYIAGRMADDFCFYGERKDPDD
jgi:hypothetical protein